MATIYYDNDCDLSLLEGRVIGIIGYGSQGHAQAQNLRDSGLQVIVAEAEGSPGWNKAKEDGFEVSTADGFARKADVIMMLAPDTLQAKIYHQSIVDDLTSGKMLMFAHGFNIH
ncbi:MAG: NAD(P)-binding domain-containing protein, partial [Dehalococcoidales bacterium]|nr:NAD(P)-binding domain-containing protein [Dehalococcoidales bacterium]